jgi:hypothetical protein
MNVSFSSTRHTSRVNLLSLKCELIFKLKVIQRETKCLPPLAEAPKFYHFILIWTPQKRKRRSGFQDLGLISPQLFK